jgi:hypothetical protein
LIGLIILMVVAVWQWYERRTALIEGLLTDTLGRIVLIDQITQISLGRQLTVSVERLKVTNPQWVQAPFFLEAAHVRLELDLFSLLFDKQLYLTNVELDRLTLGLESRDDRGNWLFNESNPSPSTGRRVIVANWTVTDSSVSYLDEDQDVTVSIIRSDGEMSSNSTPLHFRLNGSVNAVPFHSEGDLATIESILDQQSTDLDLTAKWGDTHLEINGSVTNTRPLNQVDLDLKLKAPTAGPLLETLGVHEVRDGALDLDIRLTSTGGSDNRLVDISFTGSLGELFLSAVGTASDLSEFEELDLTVDFSGPSLYETGAVLDYLAFDPLPFAFAGELKKRGSDLTLHAIRMELAEGSLEANGHLPSFPEIADGTFSIKGQNFDATILQPLLLTCELPDEPLNWQGHFENRQLHLTLEGAQHRLALQGQFAANSPTLDTLQLSLNGFTYHELGQCLGVDNLPDEPIIATSDISIEPETLRFTSLSTQSNLVNIKGYLEIGLNSEREINAELSIESRDLAATLRAFKLSPGALRSFPISLKGQLNGPLANLNVQTSNLIAANQTGEVFGNLGNPDTLEGLDLSFSFEGDDFSQLVMDDEATATDLKPFSIAGSIQKANAIWSSANIDLKIFRSEIKLAGQISTEPGFNNSTILLSAAGENLENILGPWVRYPLPQLAYKLAVDIDYSDGVLSAHQLDLSIGGHRVEGEFSIDSPPDLSKTRGRFSLSGPDIQEFSLIAGLPSPPISRPYRADIHMEGSATSARLNKMILEIGESNLTGEIKFTPGEPWDIDAQLHSKVLFAPLLISEKEDEITGTSQKGAMMFAPTPLAWHLLDYANVQLRYGIDQFTTATGTSTALNLDASISDGTLKTKKLAWHGDISIGSATLVLSNSTEPPTLDLKMISNRIPFLWLFAGEPTQSEDTQYLATLHSSGASPRDLAGNLDGLMLFHGGGGKIPSSGLDWLFGDFLHQASTSILGRTEVKESNVTCTAGSAWIKSGQAVLDPGFTIRTDKVDVFVTGTINLKSEVPNLTINTRSRTGVGVSAYKAIVPRTKVGGTLTKPSIAPSSTGSALSGGAAFLSGGMSILVGGIWDRIKSGSANPCETLYKVAAEQPEFLPLIELSEQKKL